MSVKTFDVKHFNSVSRSSRSEDQWSLFFFFLSHIRRNRLILFYSILWGLTFEYSIICQRHIISDSDVAHYSTPFPTVVCGIYSCNVTRFLFRQVFFSTPSRFFIVCIRIMRDYNPEMNFVHCLKASMLLHSA